MVESLPRLPHPDLLDFGRLAELMGYDRKLNTLDFPGHAARLPDPRQDPAAAGAGRRERRAATSGSFDELLAATAGELEAVDGVGEVRAKEIREGLRRLQEINLVDRYLQT